MAPARMVEEVVVRMVVERVAATVVDGAEATGRPSRWRALTTAFRSRCSLFQ